MTAPDLPTIILVGGPFTAEDGTGMDSRQPLDGDLSGRVLAECLGTSWLWWQVALSLAEPLLREVGDAAGLLQGPRSVIDVTPAGIPKRTRLRGLLHGEVGTLFTRPVRDQDRRGEHSRVFEKDPEGARWYFLEPGSYDLPPADVMGVALTCGASTLAIDFPVAEAAAESSILAAFENSLVPWCGHTVIAPDTANTRALLSTYLEWIAERRPIRLLERWREEKEYDPANPDPIRYTKIVPVSAKFGVTGLIRHGSWEASAPLEAARALLEARYDYQFGLWDLTDNDTLRSALLSETPVAPVPETVAYVPGASRRRAVAAAQTRADLHRTRQEVIGQLAPVLTAAGWERLDNKRSAELRLPLTEPVERWPGADPEPLVSCWIRLLQRQTRIDVRALAQPESGFGDRLEPHRDELEAISPDHIASFAIWDPCVWRADGGLADAVDWHRRACEIAHATGDLRVALGSYVAAAQDELRTRLREYGETDW